MWNKIRAILRFSGPAGEPAPVSRQNGRSLRQQGYLEPLPVMRLLETESRQHLLRQLWENCLLPEAHYKQYFLTPLKVCVSLMQQLPATASGHHAVPGGMVDYMLETVVFATRLSQGYMLPPGASAEEQSAQRTAWGAVVFYCALSHSLSLLRQIEGELLDGEIWFPGISVPGQPYRFRFRPEIPEGAGEGLCTMLGMRLLPGEVIQWLSKTPLALDSLLSFLRGDFGHAGVIARIVENAIRHAGGTAYDFQGLSGVSLSHRAPATGMTAPAAVAAATGDNVGNSPVEPELSTEPDPAQPVLPSAEKPESILTSALDDNGPPPVPAYQDGQSAEDQAIRAAISLMGFGEAPPAEETDSGGNEADTSPDAAESAEVHPGASALHSSVPAEVTPSVPGSPPDVPASPGVGNTDLSEDSEDYGQQFMAWLSTQIISGSLPVNTRDALVHIVGGLIFLPIPAVFFSFMKEKAYPFSLKNDVQRGFERLGLHFMKKGKGVYTCLKYESENRKGRYEKLSGYLIRSKIIYAAHPVPADSLFLFVSVGNYG
ncbi:TraI domain-containing protein [Salmonella enterica subsp. enterica]|nr:hypothetical protein [Salmonella enterica]EBS1146618.1 hypothetical protein [Salmonella enterica subsp. enterica serovar Stanley]